MAQTGHFNVGVGLHGFAQHGHRVGVIQEHRIRTIFFDVRADVEHQRNIAQSAEDAGYAARVADVDVHAVFFGNLDIVPPNVRVAVEHGAQHAVRTGQRFRTAERRGDLRRLAGRVHNPLYAAADSIQPFGVDVHQRQLAVFKRRKRQQIAHNVPREDKAARTDECKFFHKKATFLLRSFCVI